MPGRRGGGHPPSRGVEVTVFMPFTLWSPGRARFGLSGVSTAVPANVAELPPVPDGRTPGGAGWTRPCPSGPARSVMVATAMVAHVLGKGDALPGIEDAGHRDQRLDQLSGEGVGQGKLLIAQVFQGFPANFGLGELGDEGLAVLSMLLPQGPSLGHEGRRAPRRSARAACRRRLPRRVSNPEKRLRALAHLEPRSPSGRGGATFSMRASRCIRGLRSPRHRSPSRVPPAPLPTIARRTFRDHEASRRGAHFVRLSFRSSEKSLLQVLPSGPPGASRPGGIHGPYPGGDGFPCFVPDVKIRF